MYFSFLPRDICLEIFSRLPIKSLLLCRCVCKTWLNLLLDSSLPDLHLSKASSSLILYPVYVDNFAQNDLYYFDSEELTSRGPIKLSMPFTEYWLKFSTVESSCNGLLCLTEKIFDSQNICICNPSTGEYVLPPKPDFPAQATLMMSGFGFDTITNQYKVVRIMIYPCNSSRYHLSSKVYTLKTAYSSSSSSWRSVGVGDINEAVMQFDGQRRYGLHVPVDGAIYWKCYRDVNSVTNSCLVSFDLSTEKLQILQIPSELEQINLGDLTLMLLEGRLSVFQTMSNDNCMKVWILMNTGSWSVQHIIKYSSASVPDVTIPKPLFFNKGEIVFLYAGQLLVAYDLIRRVYRRPRFLRNMDTFVAIPHIWSLISLNHEGSCSSKMATKNEYCCFVGGLAWVTDEQALGKAFGAYGEILQSKIIYDRLTGRSRGFGFVTFANAASMRMAIENMNGKSLDGRNMTVNKAQSKGSGGGGGGGGGYHRSSGGGGRREGNSGGYRGGGGGRRERNSGGYRGGGVYGRGGSSWNECGRDHGYGGGGGESRYSSHGGDSNESWRS